MALRGRLVWCHFSECAFRSCGWKWSYCESLYGRDHLV